MRAIRRYFFAFVALMLGTAAVPTPVLAYSVGLAGDSYQHDLVAGERHSCAVAVNGALAIPDVGQQAVEVTALCHLHGCRNAPFASLAAHFADAGETALTAVDHQRYEAARRRSAPRAAARIDHPQQSFLAPGRIRPERGCLW